MFIPLLNVFIMYASTAVMKTMAKYNLGEKGLFQLIVGVHCEGKSG